MRMHKWQSQAFIKWMMTVLLTQILLILFPERSYRKPLAPWVCSLFKLLALLMLLILFYNLQRSSALNQMILKRGVAKNLLLASWPFLFAGVFVHIYIRIDQIMIANIVGIEGAGIYAVAIALVEQAYIIPVLLCTSLFPTVVKLKEQSAMQYEKFTKIAYSFMFYASLTIAAVIFFGAEFVVPFLYGVSYAESVEVLQVYVWAEKNIVIKVAVLVILHIYSDKLSVGKTT